MNHQSDKDQLCALAASGLSLRAISEKLNIPRGKLRRMADRAGLDFSHMKHDLKPVDLIELERMYSNGMSMSNIARRLNVSDKTVSNRLVSLGLRAINAPTCKFCQSPAKAKGMCGLHYKRALRAADGPKPTYKQRVHALCVDVAPYVQSMPPELAQRWADFLESGDGRDINSSMN